MDSTVTLTKTMTTKTVDGKVVGTPDPTAFVTCDCCGRTFRAKYLCCVCTIVKTSATFNWRLR